MSFVKVDRRIYASFLWEDERPFSRLKAWLDILNCAAYRDGNGLMAGEVRLSIRKTATRWGWAQTTVHRFIARLISEGMMERTDKNGTYKIGWNTLRNAKRNTSATDTQQVSEKSGTPSGTGIGKHTLFNKKEYITKKGGVCSSHTPTPLEDVSVSDADWSRFTLWADENIHWMARYVTREMYEEMRRAQPDSRALADILIQIYYAEQYDTVEIIDQFYRLLDN